MKTVTRAYLVDDSVAAISNFFKGILSACIAAVLIALGLAIAFFGAPLFAIVLFGLSIIGGFTLISFLVYQFFTEE